MEPTVTVPPVSPAPAKKRNNSIIIAVIAAVILSLCCCCPGIIILTGQLKDILGDFLGDQSNLIGLICVGAAIIPLFIPVIVFLVQRSKK